MSLVVKNGMPAKMSMSKSFTTRASSFKSTLFLDNIKWVSPAMDKGVR